MTERYVPTEDAEDSPQPRRLDNLSGNMTALEWSVGRALWQHARVKIPKDALVRVALDLAEHQNPDARQELCAVTYSEFYGKVGVPQ